MKFDILTFGSITLDVILKLNQTDSINISKNKTEEILKIALGEKIKVNESVMTCGGGAANSATGFAKLGLKTALFGVMGDKSNRGFLMQELKSCGVNTDFVTFAKESTSSFSIVLNTWTGDRTVFHHRTMCEDFNEDTLEKAPETRAIYVGHLYEGPDQMLFHIPRWKERTQGLVGWNPGKTQFGKGFSFFEEIFPMIDVLILNVEEAELFTGLKSPKIKKAEARETIIGKKITLNHETPVDFLSDCRALADKFLSAGIKKVVITDAGRGAQIFEGNHHFWSPSQKAKKVDTLGAGDAFSVGILSAILYGKTLKEQIQWANISSNEVIKQIGAQAGQIYLGEMEAKMTDLFTGDGGKDESLKKSKTFNPIQLSSQNKHKNQSNEKRKNRRIFFDSQIKKNVNQKRK